MGTEWKAHFGRLRLFVVIQPISAGNDYRISWDCRLSLTSCLDAETIERIIVKCYTYVSAMMTLEMVA